MNEILPTQREDPDAPAGLGSLFSESSGAPNLVIVSHGLYTEFLPVGGRSVGEIRRRFGDRLDLDPRSQAVLEGRNVADDEIVPPGQALMFTRPAGEKGAARWRWKRF